MSKILVLITAEDPLESSASFVKNELPYSYGYFDQIFVFSEYRKNKKPIKYSANCEIIGLNMNAKIKYYKYICYGLSHSNESIKDVENVKGFKKRLFRMYEKGKSIYMFNVIRRILSNRVQAGDSIVFYSYWLLNTATCAIALRDYFIQEKRIKAIAVSRTHGYDLYSERNSLHYLPFQAMNVNKLDYVFPCSQVGVDYLLQKYKNVSRDKIVLQRLGTKDYGLGKSSDDGVFRFVTCSSLIPLKRISLFAKAFKKLQEIANVHWTCIGSGTEMSNIKKTMLDVQSDKYSLLGKVENDSIFDFYKNQPIDCFVNVSETEGVPVSIMEAMSFGTPVIATDVGGNGEIVDNKNGIIISKNIDVDYLYLKLLYFVNNYKTSFREESRKKWESKSNAQINYCIFFSFLLGCF